MLHLKQVTQPFAWERDHITGEYIKYGQFYYWDDDDNFVVSRKTYMKFKDMKKREDWDYSRLQNAASQYEYEQAIKEQTREFQMETLLDRKVEGED